MLHKIHCQDPWYSFLKNGQKPVEGRKNSKSFAQIKIGDQIEFYLGDKSFVMQVVYINKYESVEEYLEKEGLNRALPGVKTIEEGLKIYHQWNSPSLIKDLGFLGIGVKLV